MLIFLYYSNNYFGPKITLYQIIIQIKLYFFPFTKKIILDFFIFL